ncbi:iron chaperone [Arthrobacter sp. NPDC090010]|uniref:iron chaperone n=1 Tax=Arthrobacter sp. NPDC090010 TaxID=3363942 RepID=UPI0038204D46
MATETSGPAFSEDERAAMKERAREVKATRGKKKPTPEEFAVELLEKIASMDGPDRVLAEHIHAIVQEHAPELSPKLWYGMQSYANAAGVSVVFFQDAKKFKARYATLGFQATAALDDGPMWPTSYALTAWTPEVEERVIALVKRAVSADGD